MAGSLSTLNNSSHVHYVITWKELQKPKYETTLDARPLILRQRNLLHQDDQEFVHELEQEIFLMAHQFYDATREVTYKGAKAKLYVRVYDSYDEEAETGLHRVMYALERMKTSTETSSRQKMNEAWEHFISISEAWFLRQPTQEVLPPTAPSTPVSRSPVGLQETGYAADIGDERGHITGENEKETYTETPDRNGS